jgi:hypothetical protein
MTPALPNPQDISSFVKAKRWKDLSEDVIAAHRNGWGPSREEVAEELVDCYHTRLRRWCYRFTRDHAAVGLYAVFCGRPCTARFFHATPRNAILPQQPNHGAWWRAVDSKCRHLRSLCLSLGDVFQGDRRRRMRLLSGSLRH